MTRVRFEKKDHVARVTLDRPEVLNAMDLRMHEELADIWDDIEGDDRIRVTVLTGAGDRAFSVGQDLKERAGRDAAGTPASTFGSRGQPGWPRLTERFGFSKPVVARVDGYALGGGFELVLACDLVVASDRSVFGLPEVRLGLVPGAGGVFRLIRQVPQKVAMGYLLTGRRFDAATAYACGLVNDVVPAERLDECVEEWVADLVASAPLSVRAIKEAALRSVDLTLPDAFTATYRWEERRRQSADAVEGPRAFAEKRPPVWSRPATPHSPPGEGKTMSGHGTSEAERPRPSVLRKDRLHASLSDPVLDTMTFLNEVTMRFPDAISFAPGRPYDGFFDSEDIFAYLRRYLDHLAGSGRSPELIRTALYQYGPTAGQIRELIADSLRVDEQIDVPAGSIVVTVGAQEGMLLVLRALIAGPDDVLMVSSPCYVGITGAARLLNIPMVDVEEPADGFSCADVEAAILREHARGRRPRAFYLVPDHSNPSGTTIGPQARTELLSLAARHDLLIIEDSPYRLVSPGRPLPTLKSQDRSGVVVHLGSYSKTVFPGARVGYVVADQRIVDGNGRTSLLADELSKIKSMVTVNTSSLSQAVVAGALLASGGRISELNAKPASYYGDAMQATLRQLDRQLPAARRDRLGVRWNTPTGGFFLTVQVSFEADEAALTRAARNFGVIWTPMRYFYPSGGGDRMIRLSTSYLTPAEIDEGITRLVAFIEAETERNAVADDRSR